MHRALGCTRIINITLKLPAGFGGTTTRNIAHEEIKTSRETPRVIRDQVHTVSPLKSYSMMKLVKWSKPQRIDSKSPEGRNLSLLKDIIRSEAKIDKGCMRKFPRFDFFRQTLRENYQKNVILAEAQRRYVKRPRSGLKIKKKIVLVKENNIEEVEVVSRKIELKSPLRHSFINV